MIGNISDTASGFMADCTGQMMGGPMIGMMLGGGLVLLLLVGVLILAALALVKYLRGPA